MGAAAPPAVRLRYALAIALGCAPVSGATAHRIAGGIVGAPAATGHRLMAGGFPAPVRERRTGVVIVGAGAAGLSAAWRLRRNGRDDFLLLELDDRPGGNARAGLAAGLAHPWGAHYVVIADPADRELTGLYRDLGIITGIAPDGLPVYREEYLCAAPSERLWLHGDWQEGLVPQRGVPDAERRQLDAFLARMAELRETRGSDGRPAFAIPVDASSADPAYRALDGMTMERWLRDRGWTAPALRWYVDYCCRDDYGAPAREVSAWAGLHYFAGRRGRAANAADNAVLTWPEGNGWIVARLAERLGTRLRCGSLVYDIRSDDREAVVDFMDTGSGVTERVRCGAVIVAVPRFVAARIVEPLRRAPPPAAFTYAPWLVATLTLDGGLDGPDGPEPSWDNVVYGRRGLGYVVADHQLMNRYSRPRMILTYYEPLDEGSPDAERAKARGRTHGWWSDRIVNELARVHPGIERRIDRLDVWIWGHGMIRPVPGFIWGPERRAALAPAGRIRFAHSDMSGISIFEEAFHRGVAAADAVLADPVIR